MAAATHVFLVSGLVGLARGWCVRQLVARGADVGVTNEEGSAPVDDANMQGGGKCPCEDVSDRQWAACAAFLAMAAPMEPHARRAFAQKAWEPPAAAALHDAAERGDLLQLRHLLEVRAAPIASRRPVGHRCARSLPPSPPVAHGGACTACAS